MAIPITRASFLRSGCAALAAMALPRAARSQHGAPLELRSMTPTVQDADPGVLPRTADSVLPDIYRRQMVLYRTDHPPGTIVVDTPERFLYLIQPNGLAMRYGIRVGRDGFTWSGMQRITRKTEWPDWTPPPEMIQRQPYLPRFMAGGPGNPMGSRAMYLGTTIYRIHGTNAPETIGHAVSSGCFGLANEEIVDLYARVPVGTRVIVSH